jgi:hypothetical protein
MQWHYPFPFAILVIANAMRGMIAFLLRQGYPVIFVIVTPT